MQKVRLTSGRIDKLVCPTEKSQIFLFDSEIQGLAVRVTSSGNKAFIFESKLDKKTIRITIGNVHTWTIDAAYKEARRLKTLCDSGTDPRLDKAHKLAENASKLLEVRRQTLTLGDVWPRYLESRKNLWSPRHFLDHQRVVHLGGDPRIRSREKLTKSGVLVPLIPVKLSDFTAKLIHSWLEIENQTRPTQAHRAFTLLRAFFSWCEEQEDLTGLIPPNVCQTKVVRETLIKPSAKDDCLQREQLAIWFVHVKAISNPIISAYLQVLLLTGARREEIGNLMWDDIDFRWNSMLIRDKVDGERIIPLTPYVARLLNELPRCNQWVFSSNRAESGRLVEPRSAHNRALAAAELPHISLHGLRRSFGTLSEWVEVPTGIVAQIMGHKPSATAEKHYRRRPIDLLRLWHERIENWILTQAELKVDAH